MLRSRDFWVGILVGALLFYLYQNHFKKGMGGA
jgi:hypothetical protein